MNLPRMKATVTRGFLYDTLVLEWQGRTYETSAKHFPRATIREHKRRFARVPKEKKRC